MDFELSPEQRAIRRSVREIATDYGSDYWRDVRMERRFPEEIYADLAEGGWLGLPIPEEYGGQDLGFLEAVLVMEVLAEEGAWELVGALILAWVFGGVGLVEHGTEVQKDRYLPDIVAGESRWAIAVTEPEAGSNTANIRTAAERIEGGTDAEGAFRIDGHKQWISGIDRADRVLLLARTTPREAVEDRFDGLTAFVVDPDDDGVEYEEIPIDVYYRDRTYDVHLDGVEVPRSAVLGDVDDGMTVLWATLNTERITAAAEAWGMGRWALDRAVDRAREREVWDEPIGAHQGLQHPLADAHASLLAARGAIRKAAWQYDQDVGDIGETSNVANLLAGQAAWQACEAAMTTFGGASVAAEYGIAAAWGTVRHYRTAPVSEEMIRNFIGHHSLGLPRSY